jgi:hypothetical protein
MPDISLTPVIIRFFFGGSAVVASTIIARTFGGRLGGIFAAFPAVYIAASLTLSLQYKNNDLLVMSRHISQGALVGMLANIICAISANKLIVSKGWQKGLTLALLIWLLAASIFYFIWQLLL